MKAPKTKLQAPEKLQIQTFKTVMRRRVLDLDLGLGIFLELGVWDLGFGISVNCALTNQSCL